MFYMKQTMYVYRFLVFLSIPYAMVRILKKSRKDKNYLCCLAERFGKYNLSSSDSIWVHACSVGEVIAASKIIDELVSHNPKQDILITVLTPTGKDKVKQLYSNQDKVICVYLPYDISFAIKKLLQSFKPKILVLLETEIWPNLISICQNKKIPVLLANARLSKKSCRNYTYAYKFFNKIIGKIDVIATQYETDAKRFRFLGAKKSQVRNLGSVKYDLAQITKEHSNRVLHGQKFKNTLIAVSTHHNEEEIIIRAFIKIKQKIADAKLILVPRHSYRSKKIAQDLQKNSIKFCRHSKIVDNQNNYDALLVDEMGMLKKLYEFADIAFIGGSLIEHGGQNPIEAAGHGLPLLMGPSRYNFDYITKSLKKDSAIINVNNADDIYKNCYDLLQNSNYKERMGAAAKQNVMSQKGSSIKYVELIKKIISA